MPAMKNVQLAHGVRYQSSLDLRTVVLAPTKLLGLQRQKAQRAPRFH
jgi:hypothetical protein